MDDPNSEPHLYQKIDNSLVEGQIAQSQEDVNQNQGSGNQNVQKANQRGLFNLSVQYLSDLGNPSIPQYDYRKNLLSKVEKLWVEPVLSEKKKLLDGRKPIKLILEKRLDLVAHHHDPRILESEYQIRNFLDNNTTIIDVFSDLSVGGVLIVGDAGSGKTLMLMELSKYLIDLARDEGKISKESPNHPIPVVFQLSNWEENQLTQNNFDKWLIQELNRVYKLSEKASQNLVYGNHLIVMLDGLDEIFEEKRRTLCIEALNKFIDKYGLTKIVVCSREREYKKLNKRLKIEYAVGILPISDEQLKLYLDDAGEKLDIVKNLIQKDEILQELSKTPLMLNMMAIVYQDANKLLRDLPRSLSIKERRKNLFDRYTKKMLKRRGGIDKEYVERQIRRKRRYPNEQTEEILVWLAQSMSEEGQSIFYIERMQPSLLEPGLQKWMYRIGVALLTTFTVWLVFFIPLLMLQEQTSFIMGEAIIGGAVVGLWRVLKEAIEPVETLESAWKNISSGWKSKLKQQQGFIGIVLFSWLVSAIYGLVSREIKTDINGLIVLSTTLIVVFLIVFILLISVVLSLGLKETTISDKLRDFPNQGINKTLHNTLNFATMSAIVSSIILSPIALAIGKPWNGIITGIMLGLFAGIYPFSVYIQHLMLRLVLRFRTDSVSIPLRLVCFLDYAEERILVRKVGGGYEFIHKLLQEHFAQK